MKCKNIVCPYCNSDKYEYSEYKEECWGGMYIVERHGYCPRCGYRVEMSYSPELEGFDDKNILEAIKRLPVRILHLKRSFIKPLFDFKTKKMFKYI